MKGFEDFNYCKMSKVQISPVRSDSPYKKKTAEETSRLDDNYDRQILAAE